MEESAKKHSSKSSRVVFVPCLPLRSPRLSSSQNVCNVRCMVKGSWQHNQALLCPFHQKSKKRLEESLSMLPHIMYIQETHVLLLVLRTICVWLVCKDTTALPLGSLSSFLCNLYRIKMNPLESHVCHSWNIEAWTNWRFNLTRRMKTILSPGTQITAKALHVSSKQQPALCMSGEVDSVNITDLQTKCRDRCSSLKFLCCTILAGFRELRPWWNQSIPTAKQYK